MDRILIDPGHGGMNTGTVWPPGINPPSFIESHYVLMLARRLETELRHEGFGVVLTRTDDSNVGLSDRRTVERMYNPAAVVSLHVNALGSQKLRGASAFHWPGSGVGGAMSRAFMRAIPYGLQGNAKPIVETDLTPWKLHARNVVGSFTAPCMLAEVGFITHPTDRAILTKDVGQIAIVSALKAAVLAGVATTKGSQP